MNGDSGAYAPNTSQWDRTARDVIASAEQKGLVQHRALVEEAVRPLTKLFEDVCRQRDELAIRLAEAGAALAKAQQVRNEDLREVHIVALHMEGSMPLDGLLGVYDCAAAADYSAAQRNRGDKLEPAMALGLRIARKAVPVWGLKHIVREEPPPQKTAAPDGKKTLPEAATGAEN